MNTEALIARYDKYQTDRSNLDLKLKVLESNIQELQNRVLTDKKQLADNRKLIGQLEEVQLIFKRLASGQVTKAVDLIQGVINGVLSEIDLKQRYELEIDASKQGDLVFYLMDKDTGKVRSTRRQTGKGISEIVSVLTIIVILKVSNSSKLLLLDEQLSGLEDASTIHMFMDALMGLANNEGFQIIMVEHKSEIKQVAGVVTFNLDLTNYEEGLKLVSTNTGGGIATSE